MKRMMEAIKKIFKGYMDRSSQNYVWMTGSTWIIDKNK